MDLFQWPGRLRRRSRIALSPSRVTDRTLSEDERLPARICINRQRKDWDAGG
jgi:hypothetical protein